MLDATVKPDAAPAFVASIIRESGGTRDKVSLTLDALILLAPDDWRPLLTALREAREWEHDDEEAMFQFEEAASACGKLIDACMYRLDNPGEGA